MVRPPEKLGKYQILEEIGKGSVGLVYRGHDPFMDRDVAVKTCSLGDEGDEHSSRFARRMFINEAQAAGSLDHPNILKVYDAGENEGVPYIVMEYLDNAETLRDYCRVDKLLPAKTAIEIIYKCAKALDYAHRRGVIHRDVKPSNIMIAGDGEVKIADFGIAHRKSSGATPMAGAIGSPRYMSPEQIREDNITTQTDLFSLGSVMYELLTGRPAFAATRFSRLTYEILNENPPPLSSWRGDLPEGLEATLRKALDKDVSTRYETGTEMCADLAAIFGNLEQSVQSLSYEDRFALARELRFFGGFSDEEVWEVVRASSWEKYAPGDRIIAEGHIDQAFFILLEGEVDVYRREVKVAILSKGDCFGEMGYLMKSRRTASIVARDEVFVMKINSPLLEQTSLVCQLRFNQEFLRMMIERLDRTTGELVDHRKQA